MSLTHGIQCPLRANPTTARTFLILPGLTKLSIDTLPPIVSRGVLLDIAKLKGQDILNEGTPINTEDIIAAAKAIKVKIESGDVVLFHTGWLNVMESDPARFMAGQPRFVGAVQAVINPVAIR